MKTTAKMVLLVLLLGCGGCVGVTELPGKAAEGAKSLWDGAFNFIGWGNKIEIRLAELAAKPKATTVEGAKALYDEVSKLILWVQDPSSPEKATAEQLEKAKALQARRLQELAALGGEAVVSGVKKVLEVIGFGDVDLKSISPKKAIDAVLGVDDPRMKKFGCPDKNEDGTPFDITKEGASKLCP